MQSVRSQTSKYLYIFTRITPLVKTLPILSVPSGCKNNRPISPYCANKYLTLAGFINGGRRLKYIIPGFKLRSISALSSAILFTFVVSVLPQACYGKSLHSL